MRNHWSLLSNGTYQVGLSGASIWVYDQQGNQLARFQDIRYAYDGAFQPGSHIFVAKSTEGTMAVYDLAKLKLLRKWTVSRFATQDHGFAFSLDGRYFYSIESPKTTLRNHLTRYRTEDWSVDRVYFKGTAMMFLEEIAFEPESGRGYLMGYFRDDEGIYEEGFVAPFDPEGETNPEQITYAPLSKAAHDYLRWYMAWQRSGFTKKRLEWIPLKDATERPPITLWQAYHLAQSDQDCGLPAGALAPFRRGHLSRQLSGDPLADLKETLEPCPPTEESTDEAPEKFIDDCPDENQLRVSIHHTALYVNDLEAARLFFMTYLGAISNEGYHNPSTGFRSYFLTFDSGAQLEIMQKPRMEDLPKPQNRTGYAHVAFSLGSRVVVDELTQQLQKDGYQVISGPRVTGDGYYESCVVAVEGNLIELTE